MLVLVLVRIGLVGLWPERMLPVTFITIAPPSVLALSGHQMGAPDALLHMFWGVAAFFTLIALTLLRRCLRQPFGMPFWGLSFPLAAFAALSLHLTPAPGVAQWVAGGLLMCVTVVITALLSATVRGLIHGELLRPEAGVSGGISGASKPVDL
jgi:tellurite resistance protein